MFVDICCKYGVCHYCFHQRSESLMGEMVAVSESCDCGGVMKDGVDGTQRVTLSVLVITAGLT